FIVDIEGQAHGDARAVGPRFRRELAAEPRGGDRLPNLLLGGIDGNRRDVARRLLARRLRRLRAWRAAARQPCSEHERHDERTSPTRRVHVHPRGHHGTRSIQPSPMYIRIGRPACSTNRTTSPTAPPPVGATNRNRPPPSGSSVTGLSTFGAFGVMMTSFLLSSTTCESPLRPR